MKIFVLAIPHTVTSPEFSTCAFTMKVVNLCKMMHRAGHEVYHLGVEGSQVECTEHISVVSNSEWKRFYGHPGKNFYNLETEGKYAPYHKNWAKTAKLEILRRVDEDYEAILAMTWGGTQRKAVSGLNQFEVETGIGYDNAFASYRVYESYAWLHMHLGRDKHFLEPKYYWPVIPNAFDLSMFDYSEKRGEDFLYIGRLQDSKGVRIAVDAAKRAGRKITIVGQGDHLPYMQPHVTYLPPVGVEDRRKLLREARAVFCPTQYVEPFCGVSIEAQLSGAPVICSDFGAFPENVLHGTTGYRCRTMDHFTWAARNIETISPAACRKWASENFSLERIAPMYTEYFNAVLGLKTGATDWNADNPKRSELNWLKREFPKCQESIA